MGSFKVWCPKCGRRTTKYRIWCYQRNTYKLIGGLYECHESRCAHKFFVLTDPLQCLYMSLDCDKKCEQAAEVIFLGYKPPKEVRTPKVKEEQSLSNSTEGNN